MEIVREALVIGETDDQGMAVAVILLAAVASQGHALHPIDLVDKILGWGERLADLVLGRAGLEPEQNDVLDHGLAPLSRMVVSGLPHRHMLLATRDRPRRRSAASMLSAAAAVSWQDGDATAAPGPERAPGPGRRE